MFGTHRADTNVAHDSASFGGDSDSTAQGSISLVVIRAMVDFLVAEFGDGKRPRGGRKAAAAG